MATFLFRFPYTTALVHGYVADQVSDDDVYETIKCTACTRIHLVNPKTGRVIGQADEE